MTQKDAPHPFAVVMNTKARKVKKSTIDLIARHVPEEDLFITRTVEQSDECLKEIVARRYPLVFCGGGDGTAMRIIEQLLNHIRKRNAAGGDFCLPAIGILKLGTGNGWAGLMNTPPGALPIEIIKGLEKPKTRTFNMIVAGDRLAHFASFGLDAFVVNNYLDLKNRYPTGLSWKLANSLVGYLFATFCMSAPILLLKPFQYPVRVINESEEPVYRVSHSRGVEETEIKKGEVIFEGPVTMLGCGTTSNYGFNIKAYPWAMAKDGYMQLRLIGTPLPTFILHMRSFLNGNAERNDLWDFLVQRVRVECDRDMPFHLGGDPEGYRRDMTFQVAEETVEILDFAG